MWYRAPVTGFWRQNQHNTGKRPKYTFWGYFSSFQAVLWCLRDKLHLFAALRFENPLKHVFKSTEPLPEALQRSRAERVTLLLGSFEPICCKCGRCGVFLCVELT